ncbi:ABC transporter substrate-binding protein (plasmid) [Paraburkholderia sp. PREW-6R]|uniref:ABC transporter substrate-binding protein n=1 Tax=Paraburkholderia sp. PREW-6R TaxID=3141544 RepID=UPI0031F59B45
MRTHMSILSFMALMGATSAHAADTTMYVAGFGGDVEKAFREKIVPPFEAKTGVKVVYVPANSTDTLAKLQAQKGRQSISVAIIDDAPMSLAIQAGLCAKVEDGPNSKNVYPSAKRANGEAIGLGYGATGLVYNTQIFAKNGWAAPTSWKDLEDKRYAGKIVIPPITNGFGLLALVMEARLNGGGENKIDPGFATMKRISPDVLDWEPSPGKMAELLQTGDAALGVWGNGRVRAMLMQGAPVKFVYPKEGALMILSEVCPVQGAPLPQQAQAFIQYLLSPDVQAIFTAATGLGPVNKETKLAPAIAADVVYGPESVQKLIRTDINTINANRTAWTERWNREVEK